MMKKENVLISTLTLILLVGYVWCKVAKPSVGSPEIQSSKMKVSSPAFNEGSFIPPKFTCDGEDLSPPLNFGNVPADAKELVLVIDDPDAPNGNWNHWLIWGLEPSLTRIKENELPHKAILGSNDFKRLKYGGPCPPSGISPGTHRYFIKLYALDTNLTLAEGSSRTLLLEAIKGHVIEEAQLMGKYKR